MVHLIKSIKLIKKVNEKTVKASKHKGFSPFFDLAALVKYTQAGDDGGGAKISLWIVMSQIVHLPPKQQFN